MLQSIILEKKASKLSEAIKEGKKVLTTPIVQTKSPIEYFDKDVMGTRLGDVVGWLKGDVPFANKMGKVLPIGIGAGLTGLSAYGLHDIMKNKDYNYSFNDVYWGMTGLPIYAAYRGAKKVGENVYAR